MFFLPTGKKKKKAGRNSRKSTIVQEALVQLWSKLKYDLAVNIHYNAKKGQTLEWIFIIWWDGYNFGHTEREIKY